MIAALDLTNLSTPENHVGFSYQPIEDAEAKARIREEVASIRTEMDDASSTGDEPRHDRLRAELEELVQHHAADLTPWGEDRGMSRPNPAENARIGIRRALARAYQKLRDSKPSLRLLAEHLEVSLHTQGQGYVYEPRPSAPAWDL